MTGPEELDTRGLKPYKTMTAVMFVIGTLILALVYMQFRGSFSPKTRLTMLADRAGLVMYAGSPVTYNGVHVGRVGNISEVTRDGAPAARFVLDMDPKYIQYIPANVVANITATTIFGSKYVALTPPEHPVPQRITSHDEIDARSVTTEINTLFQTITEISHQLDPIKLNLTLTAAADALTGLGDKFGRSIINANTILDDVNPRMPQFRRDIQQLAAVNDVYTSAAPDLFDFLDNSVTTAKTVRRQEKELDQALLAATGLANTGEDIFRRGGPYFQRLTADLVPTAELLDTYSPEIYCMIRNYHDIGPQAYTALGGGNGYSLAAHTEALSMAGLALSPFALPLLGGTMGAGGLAGLLGGAPNPYTYPENLPRINAHGGPGGAPGCWQPITRDLWPAPTLLMDTGATLAPYNHLEVGSPYAIEYVWGRQVGENTINP
ncbi:MAG TPA: MCE family protein [Mycobacterium sp.]|nr:MCE family protein [Mycobacterium sp.]